MGALEEHNVGTCGVIEEQIGAFLDRMALALRQAGVVANALRGKTPNIGKASESLDCDSEIHRAQRSALTIVDTVVQEIILLAASRVPGFRLDQLTLDAEEATPARGWFARGESRFSLVIDPIDGTHEYLTGTDKYSICVGLVCKGRMLTALVYFPARDHLYFLDPRGRGHLSTNTYSAGLEAARELSPITGAQPPRVYKNSRVPSDLVRDLRKVGLEVYDDTDDGITCAGAILGCISGKAVAYVAHSRQMRDMLLGAILAGVPTGYALDWSGQTLTWPSAGRVPTAVFGVGDHRDEILDVLRTHV